MPRDSDKSTRFAVWPIERWSIRSFINALVVVSVCVAAIVSGLSLFGGHVIWADSPNRAKPVNFDQQITTNINALITEGRNTFRFDTLGDEVYWGNTLKLHLAIEGRKFGGIGTGISPRAALKLGLKFDVDAVPGSVLNGIDNGSNLDDPANTLALLKANAIVGLTGFFNADGTMKSVGIQCALCHSTVDNSFGYGVGHRIDGFANHDLDVGQIMAAAPNLSSVAAHLKIDESAVRRVLTSWGPGKFDAWLGHLPHVSLDQDRIMVKLTALHFYQFALAAATPFKTIPLVAEQTAVY